MTSHINAFLGGFATLGVVAFASTENFSAAAFAFAVMVVSTFCAAVGE